MKYIRVAGIVFLPFQNATIQIHKEKKPELCKQCSGIHLQDYRRGVHCHGENVTDGCVN